MANIASLQDFRGEGAPADIGEYVIPANVVVYQASFGGTTYVCAARSGVGGWALIKYLPLTGANATTVINAALGALTTGRTWKETVVVVGNYVDLGTIYVPSYTLLVIYGSWRLEANHSGSWIVNANGVSGNVWIEICGGKLDGNQANQTTGGNVINFRMSDDCWVHHMEIICAYRTSASAEGVYEGTGVQFAGNGAGTAGSYRGIVAFCRIRNMYKDGVQFERAPDGIVYACTFVTTVSGSWETSAVQFAYAADNGICFGCTCDVGNLVYTKGYKIHGCSNCIIAFNIAENARVNGIWLGAYDYADNDNIIMGNRIIGPGLQGTGIILMGPNSSYRNLIMGNNISGHTIGIDVDGSTAIMYDTRIIGNSILGVNNLNERGIRATRVSYLLVENNHVSKIGAAGTTASAGIVVRGASKYCLVNGNTLMECAFGLRTETVDTSGVTYAVWTSNLGVFTGTGATTFFNMNGGSYHIVAYNTAIDYNGYGVTIDAGIDYVWIYCNHFIALGLETLHRFTAGSNIYVYLNSGYKTEDFILSDTFAIDSTGVKTITVSHGLGDPAHGYQPYTPPKQCFQLTVVEETAVDDWGYDLLKVVSATTTSVTIKINVSKASATTGATARIGVLVTTGLPNRPGGL
jgi:hypothetical protein